MNVIIQKNFVFTCSDFSKGKCGPKDWQRNATSSITEELRGKRNVFPLISHPSASAKHSKYNELKYTIVQGALSQSVRKLDIGIVIILDC